MSIKYYAAYGSNLNLNQMKKRCPSAKPIDAIMLKNYRIVYKGGEDSYAYLTLEPAPNSYVPIGIFKLKSKDISNLDYYEGYPDFYLKYTLFLETLKKPTKALIYIMNNNFNYHLPSREYIEICREGYKDFGFNLAYLDQAFNDTVKNIPKTLKRTILPNNQTNQ